MPDSHRYYFRVGNGTWRGKFSFHMEDWKTFWHNRVGLRNVFLTICMVVVQKLFGASTILSTLRPFPEWGPNGVATNVVRIKKLGVTLYLLKEQYVLNPDGTNVFVESRERFGPVPFLFRKKKRHPARIHEGGTGATYLDMPLLGTLWEGNYKVLEDGHHIDANLTCEWASAQEVITRVAPGPETAPVITEHRNNVKDLDTVIDRLQMYRNWQEAVRDPMAVFTHAYITITKIFREEIPIRDFKDRDWIIRLDVAFAQEFFYALDAYALGETVPKGWWPVLEVIREEHTSVLEELILSMAAHIIHDLPLALKEVQMNHEGQSKVRDFHLANEILEYGINKIQEEVARRYNPFLRWLDRLGKGEDEILTNYGIRVARAVAWFNGERLTNPESEEEALASIARSTQVAVQQLLKPPLLSLRIVLRMGRWVSGSTRVWPGEQVL